MPKVTNRDLPLSMFKSGYPDDIIIPKGTRVTHQTACGIDPNYNFIADLSWIPAGWGILKHDCTYYGINVPVEYLEEKEK